MADCGIPGGTMLRRNDGIQEGPTRKRIRLCAVLKWELSHGVYSNAWVTLYWLTTTKNILGYRKIRVRKTDLALMMLEANHETRQGFDINWKGVTCV